MKSKKGGFLGEKQQLHLELPSLPANWLSAVSCQLSAVLAPVSYTDTQINRYTDTQQHSYTATQLNRYTATQPHTCTATLINSDTDTQLNRYTVRRFFMLLLGILMHFY